MSDGHLRARRRRRAVQVPRCCPGSAVLVASVGVAGGPPGRSTRGRSGTGGSQRGNAGIPCPHSAPRKAVQDHQLALRRPATGSTAPGLITRHQRRSCPVAFPPPAASVPCATSSDPTVPLLNGPEVIVTVWFALTAACPEAHDARGAANSPAWARRSARGSLSLELGEHLDDPNHQPLSLLAANHRGKAKGSNEVHNRSAFHRRPSGDGVEVSPLGPCTSAHPLRQIQHDGGSGARELRPKVAVTAGNEPGGGSRKLDRNPVAVETLGIEQGLGSLGGCLNAVHGNLLSVRGRPVRPLTTQRPDGLAPRGRSRQRSGNRRERDTGSERERARRLLPRQDRDRRAQDGERT